MRCWEEEGLREKAEGGRVISQARVVRQMEQLHFDVGVVVRSRVAVKRMRRQWQEPVYSLGAICFLGGAERWWRGFGLRYGWSWDSTNEMARSVCCRYVRW